MKQNLLAQLIDIVPAGGSPTIVQIRGPLDTGINTIGDLIGRVLLFLIPFASIILFLALVWGGFDLLLSQGNPDKVKAGREKITAALIGFLLIVFSFVIVKLIGYLTGLTDANSPF